MTAQNQQFQIFLPGLLEVLAENLYSDSKVAIRELLQNAHDSCIRRTVEGRQPNYRPRVDITLDPQQHILTMRDNGSGLSRGEIENYLSTIGRSYTRQLGEDLAILSPEQAQLLIGQFGLGFLSAFFLASEVTLVTRSLQPDSETLRWHSVGDGSYTISPTEKAPVGTTVHLTLKPNVVSLTQVEILENTIRQYANFLPIPIYVEGKTNPVNRQRPPWAEAQPQEAIRQYIAEVFDVQNPLYVIPLHDHILDLGHDSLTIPLEGFLFIPSASVASVYEYGDVTVYIRRMFISAGTSDLLPEWARFVRGVVDSVQLQPTTSREHVQHNDQFRLVKQAVSEQLTAALRHIAQTQVAVWKRIVYGHRSVIIIWACKDEAFFNEVQDIVTFRTSRGVLTLPGYCKLTNGTLYYTHREVGSLQDQVLSESLSHPVINASQFGEVTFLTQYAARHRLKAVLLDERFDTLFSPIAEYETRLLALGDRFHEAGIQVNVVRFEPAVLPAIVVYPETLTYIEETREVLDSGHLPAPFADVIGDYITGKANANPLQAQLYLNAANALIQQVSHLTDPTTQETILTLIYQIARLLNGQLLTVTKANQLFRSVTDQLQQLTPPPKET